MSASKQLPPQPNLEQLKKQAKDLLRAHQAHNADVCQRIQRVHPRLTASSEVDILNADLTLRDAQLVVAREYGFSTWRNIKPGLQELSAVSSPEGLSEKVRQGAADDPERAAGVVRGLRGEPRKAAVLMVSLGEEISSEVMKYLSDYELETTVKAISILGEVAQEEEEEVLAMFDQPPRSVETRPCSTDQAHAEFAWATLSRSVGTRRAAEILARQNITARGEAHKARPKLSAEYRKMRDELKRKVRRTPTLQMNLDELKDLMVGMAEIARVEGIQALEGLAGDGARLEGLLREGLLLTIDGTEEDKVRSLLETQMQSLMNNYQTRCRMIIGGITALQQGDNPRMVEHMLKAFYKPPVDSA
jgi:hypothetical protein